MHLTGLLFNYVKVTSVK